MENDRNPVDCDRNTNSNAAKEMLQTMVKEKIIVETGNEIMGELGLTITVYEQ